MTIVYRQTKGSALTYAELDGNFSDLAGRTDLAWQMDGLEPTLRDGVGNPAELATFRGNTLAYLFVPGSNMETYVNWDVPFNWATGTDLYAALHWSPAASTNTGTVRWGLEYTYAPVDGTFGTTSTLYVDGTVSTSSAWKHIQTVSSAFPGSMATPNTRFLIRLFRDGAAVQDTFPDDAYLIGIDFYYQVNKFGTPSFTPPYT
jgi:hypothetical protein